MAEDNNLSFILDLDSSSFTESAKTALEAVQSIGEGGNLSGLIASLGTAAEALGAAGIVAYGFKEALDLTVEGDQIKRIDDQFNTLTANAGISTATLKKGLEDAAGGMIATTDLLKIANGAIVAMGSSASRLPEVLELARQATTVFGGDVQTNFQGMVQAIETGNTRMLKHMGIVINTTQVYNEFAEKNGLAANALSESAKQQAVLNAVLEIGHQRFAGVKASVGDTIDALTAFKAAWVELKETISVFFSDTIGPHLTGTFVALKNSLQDVRTWMQATFGTGAMKDTAALDLLQSRITETKQKLDDIQKGQGFAKGLDAGTAAVQTQQLNAQLAAYESQLQKIQATQKETGAIEKQNAAQQQANIQNSSQQSLVDETQRKKNAEKFNEEMLALDKQKTQDELKNTQEVQKAEDAANKEELKNVQSIQEVEKQVQKQRLMAAQQHAQALQKITDDYNTRELQKEQEISKVKQANYLTDEQKAKEVAAIKSKFAKDEENTRKKIALENQRYDQQEMQRAKTDEQTREQLMKNYQANSTNVFQGIARAAQQSSMQQHAALLNFGAQGEKIYQGLTNTAVTGFAAIGTAIASNQNIAQSVASAMKSAFLGMIGDVATQYGTMLLLESIFPPNPVGMAAGGALIALGSMLKSMSGQGGITAGGGYGASGGGGMGSAASINSTPSVSSAQQSSSTLQQQQTVQRSVNINIAGNYLNTSESQRTLMEVMRNETDATGFQYNKIGT